MHWPYYPLGLLAETAPGTTDPIAGITGQILSYGVVGAFAIIMAFVLYRGTFTRTSDAEARLAAVTAAADARVAAAKAEADARVTAARADLLRENELLRVEKNHAEEQRDEAMAFSRDSLAPLLQQFVNATNSLLPILQGLVAREGAPLAAYRDRDERR